MRNRSEDAANNAMLTYKRDTLPNLHHQNALSFSPRSSNLRLFNALPPHAPTEKKRPERSSDCEVEDMAHRLVISKDDTFQGSCGNNISHRSRASVDDCLGVDLRSEVWKGFSQSIRENRLGEGEKECGAEGLGEDEGGHRDGG